VFYSIYFTVVDTRLLPQLLAWALRNHPDRLLVKLRLIFKFLRWPLTRVNYGMVLRFNTWLSSASITVCKNGTVKRQKSCVSFPDRLALLTHTCSVPS
jgi:hypothetical protein